MTTMAEPEWDEQTRDLALALDAVDTCPICRGPAVECHDPEKQFDWVAGDPIRCHRQTARLAKQAVFSEETHPQMEALVWPVDRRQGA